MTKIYKTKRNIEQEITKSVIESLEAGCAPWRKSWSALGGLALRENNEPYRGFNQFILSMSGRSNPFWFTFKKAQDIVQQLEGSPSKTPTNTTTGMLSGVRKGEKGTKVCYYGTGQDKETDKSFRFLKWYTVFNADQIDGLPEKFHPQKKDIPAMIRDANVEKFIQNTGAKITHGGGRAFYSPANDAIVMPEREAFDDYIAYAGTALHELGHWTGHEKRLDRGLKSSFGTKDYAQEELTAEMSAAFMAGHLQIEIEPREDHAQYIASWITKLKTEKNALPKACAAAQRIVDHLYSYQQATAIAA